MDVQWVSAVGQTLQFCLTAETRMSRDVPRVFLEDQRLSDVSQAREWTSADVAWTSALGGILGVQTALTVWTS